MKSDTAILSVLERRWKGIVVVIAAVEFLYLEISFGRLLLEDMRTLQELVTLATQELGTHV